MKKYKKFKKQVIEEEFESLECDVCKKSFDTDNWGGDRFDIRKTSVSLSTGESYPESGDMTTKTLDICPDCINDVFGYLESKGASIRLEETWW